MNCPLERAFVVTGRRIPRPGDPPGGLSHTVRPYTAITQLLRVAPSGRAHDSIAETNCDRGANRLNTASSGAKFLFCVHFGNTFATAHPAELTDGWGVCRRSELSLIHISEPTR